MCQVNPQLMIRRLVGGFIIQPQGLSFGWKLTKMWKRFSGWKSFLLLTDHRFKIMEGNWICPKEKSPIESPTFKSVSWGWARIAQWIAFLLGTQQPLVWFSAFLRKFIFMLQRFIDGTAEKSGQRLLDNISQANLVLASGKLVLHKNCALGWSRLLTGNETA